MQHQEWQRNAAILSKSKNDCSANRKICTDNNVPAKCHMLVWSTVNALRPLQKDQLTAAIYLEVSCLNVGSCRINVVSISDIAKCRHVLEIAVFTLCRCRGRVGLEKPVS